MTVNYSGARKPGFSSDLAGNHPQEAQNLRKDACSQALDSTRGRHVAGRSPPPRPACDVRPYCHSCPPGGPAGLAQAAPALGSFCREGAGEALPRLGGFRGLMGCKLQFAPMKIYYAWTFY